MRCWVCTNSKNCFTCSDCKQNVCFSCCELVGLWKCKPCYIPFGVSTIEASYMRIANAMIVYVNKVLLKSATRVLAGLESCSTLFEDKEKSYYQASLIPRGHFFPRVEDSQDVHVYLDGLVRYCMKFSVGNCAEFALLGYDFFKSNYLSFKLKGKGVIQYCVIKRGDHSFLVIGELDDPRSIIVDPWAKTKFFMYERNKKLKNYNKGKLESFNPSKHVIRPLQFKNKGKLESLEFRWR